MQRDALRLQKMTALALFRSKNLSGAVVLAVLVFFIMVCAVFLHGLHHHDTESGGRYGYAAASKNDDCPFCKLIAAFRSVEPAARGTCLYLELPGAGFQNPCLPEPPRLVCYFPISSRAPPVF
jgi:hypothetical protein